MVEAGTDLQGQQQTREAPLLALIERQAKATEAIAARPAQPINVDVKPAAIHIAQPEIIVNVPKADVRVEVAAPVVPERELNLTFESPRRDDKTKHYKIVPQRGKDNLIDGFDVTVDAGANGNGANGAGEKS
jgi:hypothetical protein